jgi:hypothetical protein
MECVNLVGEDKKIGDSVADIKERFCLDGKYLLKSRWNGDELSLKNVMFEWRIDG